MLDWADEIINVCKLKTHGMMGMTCAAKNLFGVVPGTLKPEYHYRHAQPADFAEMILDLDEYVHPRLHICDAVVAMEGNGPSAGDPRAVGAVLAARSPHALDLACAHIIGIRPEDVPTLVAARGAGIYTRAGRGIGDCRELFTVPGFRLVTQRSALDFARPFAGPLAFWRAKSCARPCARGRR